MTDKHLTKLAIAITYLANHLGVGQRITLDRYGRSVTWDSTTRRVRGGAESSDERADFARRVFEGIAAAPRAELAEGLQALRPGQRLHLTRLSKDVEIALMVPGQDLAVQTATISSLDERADSIERCLKKMIYYATRGEAG